MTNAVASAFLSALREREASHDHPEARRWFAEAYSHLIASARQGDATTRDHLLVALRDGFSDSQSNFEFGCLANACGQIVEIGADSAITIDPILDRVTAQLARVNEFVRIMQEHFGIEHPNRVAEQDWPRIGREHPDHAWVVAEWFALRFTGGAVMTMLCRDVESRKAARSRVDLHQNAEAARSDNPYAYYLAETLGMVDDERLLVLDTTRKLAFRVRLMAVRNNFHLFTLLQDALLKHATADGWRGPRVRPVIAAVARGERMLPDISPNEWSAEDANFDGQVTDTALWTYGTILALSPVNTVGPPPWVWGEMKPTEIPTAAGERILVLTESTVPRSWDIGFFAPLHPALRSEVEVELVIPTDSYDQLVSSLGLS